MTDDAPTTDTQRGTVVFGYDGSPASQRAIEMTAPILAPKRALVVTVWEPGTAYAVLTPTAPLAPIDFQVAAELEEALYEDAQRTAEHGAAAARALGLEADGLAVVDTITVANTLARLAREHDASAIVVGSKGHSRVRELLLGSTTRGVIHDAPCPVCVVPCREEPSSRDRENEG